MHWPLFLLLPLKLSLCKYGRNLVKAILLPFQIFPRSSHMLVLPDDLSLTFFFFLPFFKGNLSSGKKNLTSVQLNEPIFLAFRYGPTLCCCLVSRENSGRTLNNWKTFYDDIVFLLGQGTIPFAKPK